jgi:hypothetical protein
MVYTLWNREKAFAPARIQTLAVQLVTVSTELSRLLNYNEVYLLFVYRTLFLAQRDGHRPLKIIYGGDIMNL